MTQPIHYRTWWWGRSAAAVRGALRFQGCPPPKKSWLTHGKGVSKKASGRPREGWGLHPFNTGHLGQVSSCPSLARSLGNQALLGPFPHELPDLGGVPGAEEGAGVPDSPLTVRSESPTKHHPVRLLILSTSLLGLSSSRHPEPPNRTRMRPPALFTVWALSHPSCGKQGHAHQDNQPKSASNLCSQFGGWRLESILERRG